MRNVTSKADTTHPTIADTASSTILASSANRKAASIYNEGPGDLYLKYGSGASTISYKTKILANELWLMPVDPIFTGLISGYADGGACVLAVTEEY